MVDDKWVASLRSGRRRKEGEGRTPEDVNTHKIRARWFQARESWPVREAPTLRLLRERARMVTDVRDVPGNEQWQLAGPTNIGGRMTSIVHHAADPDRILAGAAGGGVWGSDDAGLTWRPLFDDQPTLNIGALAADPQAPDTVYCGTGEANQSADSHSGIGVFRSDNFGESWQLLAASETSGIPSRIGAIAVDPFDGNHLCLGGLAGDLGNAGLYRSHDRGLTWARLNFATSEPYFCHAVLFHPTRNGTIYASIDVRGARNGIWRTTNGGTTWTHLRDGLPSDPSQVRRTSIAIAQSDPDRLYAISSDRFGGVLGVYRSDDRGTRWKSIEGGHFGDERQMFYNNTIVVDPHDADRALCGGVDLHLTTDAGRTWQQVTRWNATRGHNDYAHADQHALAMPAAAPGRVYAMNDGGMDLSEDSGATWTNRSDGLAVTMYYDLDVAASDRNLYGGGAQDNGTLITTEGAADEHFEILGGDGGWMVVDADDPVHLYASSQRMRIFRHRRSDGWTDISPLPRQDPERQATWMVYIAMDPDNGRVAFTGTRRVWRTTNDGNKWQPMSTVLDGSDITAIEVCRADTDRIYVGTENGGVFRTTDRGKSWSGNLGDTTLPGRTVTRLRTPADDADAVFCTVANTGNAHVFRSRDGALSWVDVDAGALPDVPHHSVVIPAAHPRHVYVCNDAGVYVSTDNGGRWRNLTRNLPPVMVVDLVHHDADQTLFAATYGRSIWTLDVPAALR
ncbi:MAG: hypothetical protein OEU32_07200 [Acidimicrobiia bacterium]|nr:hypothetical protein [Acidimicrobiia bacterium]